MCANDYDCVDVDVFCFPEITKSYFHNASKFLEVPSATLVELLDSYQCSNRFGSEVICVDVVCVNLRRYGLVGCCYLKSISQNVLQNHINASLFPRKSSRRAFSTMLQFN